VVSKKRKVDGQNIIYHYIQKCVLKQEDAFSEELLRRLIVDLSIWLPTEFYRKLPIILPYVVRDNSCRKKKPNMKEDEWGSANSEGFLRDDNTLLKGIVRSFPVKSSKIYSYDGRTLGTGFVASHIWGKVFINNKLMISSRNHMLNSFVPNLVWLPVQISKLTDREGSFAQRLLQAFSHKIYGQISLPDELGSIWEALAQPSDPQDIDIDLRRLNHFHVPVNWITKRIDGLIAEIDAILSVDKTDCVNTRKVKSSRYLLTLRNVRCFPLFYAWQAFLFQSNIRNTISLASWKWPPSLSSLRSAVKPLKSPSMTRACST
jgi:hypothetical protein